MRKPYHYDSKHFFPTSVHGWCLILQLFAFYFLCKYSLTTKCSWIISVKFVGHEFCTVHTHYIFSSYMKKYIDEANRLFLGIQLCFEIAWSCTEISAAGWVRFFRSLASGNWTITELTKRQDLGITPCLAIHVIHWYKKTIAKRVDYPLGPRIWFRVH